MISSKSMDLSKNLRQVTQTKILAGTEKIRVISLQEDEIELLKRLGVDEKILELSKGIILNGKVVITEGPLAGIETCIRKIDRHKRKAWIDVVMSGKVMQIAAGLEITEKRFC